MARIRGEFEKNSAVVRCLSTLCYSRLLCSHCTPLHVSSCPGLAGLPFPCKLQRLVGGVCLTDLPIFARFLPALWDFASAFPAGTVRVTLGAILTRGYEAAKGDINVRGLIPNPSPVAYCSGTGGIDIILARTGVGTCCTTSQRTSLIRWPIAEMPNT